MMFCIDFRKLIEKTFRNCLIMNVVIQLLLLLLLLLVLLLLSLIWNFFSYSHFLLPGISRQQTIFLSDLRFFVQWFHGSMVQPICDCSAVQSAVYLSKCLTTAPVFLLGRTCHFVLLSCKICAEIVVDRMFAVFLNGLNDKNSSRSIVRNIYHRDRFIL